MVSADSGRAKPSADSFKGDLVDAAIDTAIFAGSMAIGGPVGGKLVTKLGGEVGNLAVKAGKYSGDAAEATAMKVAEVTERRLAEKGLEKEAAAMATPEARAATKVGAEKNGAKAEVVAQQTVEGVAKIGGVVAGGAGANQITGENGALNQPIVHPAIEAIKQTDQAVLDIVKQETPPTSRKGE